ncbi:MAG TPA: hypothetical protein VFV58_31105 [Blastocatellia bacterium]|nr:hypothetical protein [Blastocatellia bacterium]
MLSRTARSRMRTRVFYRILGVWLVFMSCLVLIGEARISVRPRYVYFYNCAGQLLKLDIRTRRVIYRREFSMMDGIPQGVVDGCLSSSLRFDARRGLLYGVFPREAKVTEDGTRHYKIVVFQLPQLKISGTIEIEPPLESPPALLVSEDGRRLLVSYLMSAGEKPPSGAQSTGVIAIYDAASLKVIGSLHLPAAPATPALKDDGRGVDGPVYFSEDAYLGEDGRTIYDRDRIITINDQRATLRRLDPDRILDHSPSPQLRSLEARNPSTGKAYLPVKYADSAAGHALLFGASTPGAWDVFFTVNLNDYRTSAIIKGPVVTSSTLHLTPNAKQAVVEEIEKPRKNGEDRQPSKAGRVLVYDMASGRQILQFKNAQLSDSRSRLLSITPDGATMFFAVSDGLLVSGPARGLAESPKVAFPVDQWTRGVFADR